jgi:purine-nucleoside phosphorylase
VRVPGRQLLERIREGAISEIVDIGCAGALDPGLRRGDLVLSSQDIAFDDAVPVAVHRRPELRSPLQAVAARRGVVLQVAPILTHERFIASRAERIELFERTSCAAVQMEHAWFLQLLKPLLTADRYEKIRITHLVLITDAVPRGTGRMAAARSTWDALSGYAFTGGSAGMMSLRREVLSSWPAE